MEVKHGKKGPFLGAIDEGTSSTRFMIFSAKNAELIAYHQIAIKKQCPKEDWVEQDPMEILNAVVETINVSVSKLISSNLSPSDIKAIGLTNQRETVVVWDKFTGRPLCNAIVWLDGRTIESVDEILTLKNCDKNVLREKTGLPISPYFSALKIYWLMKNNPLVSDAICNQTCLFGTIDSWLLWNLTGGVNGGIHCTDVTNASRTLLMNLVTLDWDSDLCDFFEIPMHILPKIRSCSEIYGYLKLSKLAGVPISGCLGDQQSALLGQNCFEKGEAKCTFGTGCFLLYNIGNTVIKSSHGLLTTVGFKLHPEDEPVYALEGSISAAGAAVQWLCDNLGILQNPQECAKIASSVDDTSGVYFVPAFTGLYAPYWRDDARSVICGLNIDTKSGHVVRATLEAICFQVRDIIDSMNLESGAKLEKLLVDGGMTGNEVLMQLLADICGVQITRPVMAESSALGAAIAAGYADGIDCWTLETKLPLANDVYYPLMELEERNVRHKRWQMAIARSLNWVATDSDNEAKQILNDAIRSIPELPQLMDTNITAYTNLNIKMHSLLPGSFFILTNLLLFSLNNFF